ncbi:hypothetical protein L1S32_03755 [Methanogenium sp. S4BF]|uniref:hypothetical protein n=1 Tax=Methanogenium sp. S4BF TaxID=1789226 RepID=UPI002417F288|nr:hypothetical protein [Methanogenium sp. S4BF]WFN35246.1 hypothetical protein L1S32_03755 [Methanogenium sp. S4BF]
MIAKIQNPDLIAYGIKESNNRAVYLTLKSFAERKKHLDTLFDLLSKGDTADIRMVLDEIRLYRDKYILTPKQLDAIVNLLTKDADIAKAATEILYDYFIIREITPFDKDRFRVLLRASLTQFDISVPQNAQMRNHHIRMLGKLRDERVVSQLIEDARNADDFESLKNDYLTPFTAFIIESHRTELFNLERELRKGDRVKEADTLAEIRKYATEHESDPLDATDPMEGIRGAPELNGLFKGMRS